MTTGGENPNLKPGYHPCCPGCIHYAGTEGNGHPCKEGGEVELEKSRIPECLSFRLKPGYGKRCVYCENRIKGTASCSCKKKGELGGIVLDPEAINCPQYLIP